MVEGLYSMLEFWVPNPNNGKKARKTIRGGDSYLETVQKEGVVINSV